MKYAKHKRSLVKTITWRVSATLITMILVLMFVNDLTIALSVGLIETFVKMFAYYVHERIWNRFSWGLFENG